MIDSTQCTVVWHIDNMTILHFKPTVVARILYVLNSKYEKLKPIERHCRKVYDHLGITMGYYIPGKVSINMADYIKKVISNSRKDMTGTATAPAGRNLFEIKESELLQQEVIDY